MQIYIFLIQIIVYLNTVQIISYINLITTKLFLYYIKNYFRKTYLTYYGFRVNKRGRRRWPLTQYFKKTSDFFTRVWALERLAIYWWSFDNSTVYIAKPDSTLQVICTSFIWSFERIFIPSYGYCIFQVQ